MCTIMRDSEVNKTCLIVQNFIPGIEDDKRGKKKGANV